MEGTSTGKRVRHETDSVPESPEAKRLRYDLLDFLDDVDDRNAETHELTSVMKLFEEEIALPVPNSGPVDGPTDLGYLLGASDDDLGLPPSVTPDKFKEESLILRGASETVGFGQIWGFDEEVSNYEYGPPAGWEVDGPVRVDGLGGVDGQNGLEILGFEGLLDYSDGGSSAVDFSELWRIDTLPSL